MRAIEITANAIGDAPMLPELLPRIPADEQPHSASADGAYAHIGLTWSDRLSAGCSHQDAGLRELDRVRFRASASPSRSRSAMTEARPTSASESQHGRSDTATHARQDVIETVHQQERNPEG